MGFLKELSLDLSGAMNQLKNFDSPENTNKIYQRLKELDQKYQLSSYQRKDLFSKKRFSKEMMVNKLIVANKYDQAEKLYKELF